MKQRNRKWKTLCLGLLMAPLSHAEGLLEVYEQALAHDLTLKQAEQGFVISEASAISNRSTLLPRLNATANYDRARSTSTVISTRFDPILGRDVSNSSSGSGDSTNRSFGLNLTQPIFDLNRWYTYKGSKLDAERAVLDLTLAQQDLIFRVTDAYLNVLRRQASLASDDTQLAAANRQLARAQRRFDVGEASATALNEARTRLDQVKLGRLITENQLAVALEALATITGQMPATLAELDESFAVQPIAAAEFDSWVTAVVDGNLALAQSSLSVESAAARVKAERFRYFPTAGLGANYTDSNSDGDGITTASERDSVSVGLQFSIPLYAGGSVKAAKQSVIAQHRQAQYRYRELERQARQSARNALRAINSSVLQVQTLQSLIPSAEKALASTRRGYEAGERTVLDLLDAEQSLANARRDFASARYDYVIAAMRLKQLSGTLSPEDIVDLDKSFSLNREVSDE